MKITNNTKIKNNVEFAKKYITSDMRDIIDVSKNISNIIT